MIPNIFSRSKNNVSRSGDFWKEEVNNLKKKMSHEYYPVDDVLTSLPSPYSTLSEKNVRELGLVKEIHLMACIDRIVPLYLL